MRGESKKMKCFLASSRRAYNKSRQASSITMTATQKPFNLLFSLPDELITEIFGTFDPTYRIFHTPEFRKELSGAGWLNAHKKTIKSEITQFYTDLIRQIDEYIIVNEYGYFGYVESLEKNERTLLETLLEYTETNFEIYLHPATDYYMYFKVLPKGATKSNCAFLRNPRKFDGYVFSYLSYVPAGSLIFPEDLISKDPSITGPGYCRDLRLEIEAYSIY